MLNAAQLKPFLERLLPMASVYCVLFGLMVLVGWFFNIDFLKNPIPNQIPVAPSTALCFLCLGSALLQGHYKTRNAQGFMRLMACLVSVIGIAVLCPYVSEGKVDLENFFWGYQLADINQFAPGRMSPNSAVGMLLAGWSVYLLSFGETKPFYLAQQIACLIGLIGYFTVVGYLYNIALLYGFASFTRIAMPTGVTFVVLALAIAFYRPFDGLAKILVDTGAAGVLARRLLPAALVVPLALGLIKVFAEHLGLIDEGSGPVFMVVAETLVMLVLIGITTSALAVLDEERLKLKIQRANFMAVLIHDLEEPLISSEQLLEQLRCVHMDSLTQEQQAVFTRLSAINAEHSQKIKNLFEYQRLDQGAEARHLKAIDLAKMLARVAEKFQALAQSQNKRIQVNLPESLPEVMGDEAALEQVVSNLLQNALKFTGADGSIELTANALKFLVDIQVRDNGKGISVADQKKLFKAFGPDAVAGELPSGTGLGLYLCDQIVKAHNGHLTCISEFEHGSTFVISLPRDTAFQPPPALDESV